MCTSESITKSSIVRLAFFALGVCFLCFVTPLASTHLSLGNGLKVANYFFIQIDCMSDSYNQCRFVILNALHSV